MGVHGVRPTAMKSPFSNWAGESDAESQMKQARLKALGKRRKSHKKIALEVVEEAEKEGEEGMTMHAFFVLFPQFISYSLGCGASCDSSDILA